MGATAKLKTVIGLIYVYDEEGITETDRQCQQDSKYLIHLFEGGI